MAKAADVVAVMKQTTLPGLGSRRITRGLAVGGEVEGPAARRSARDTDVGYRPVRGALLRTEIAADLEELRRANIDRRTDHRVRWRSKAEHCRHPRGLGPRSGPQFQESRKPFCVSHQTTPSRPNAAGSCLIARQRYREGGLAGQESSAMA